MIANQYKLFLNPTMKLEINQLYSLGSLPIFWICLSFNMILQANHIKLCLSIKMIKSQIQKTIEKQF